MLLNILFIAAYVTMILYQIKPKRWKVITQGLICCGLFLTFVLGDLNPWGNFIIGKYTPTMEWGAEYAYYLTMIAFFFLMVYHGAKDQTQEE